MLPEFVLRLVPGPNVVVPAGLALVMVDGAFAVVVGMDDATMEPLTSVNTVPSLLVISIVPGPRVVVDVVVPEFVILARDVVAVIVGVEDPTILLLTRVKSTPSMAERKLVLDPGLLDVIAAVVVAAFVMVVPVQIVVGVDEAMMVLMERVYVIQSVPVIRANPDPADCAPVAVAVAAIEGGNVDPITTLPLVRV